MSCFSKREQIYDKFYFRQVFLKNNLLKFLKKNTTLNTSKRIAFITQKSLKHNPLK